MSGFKEDVVFPEGISYGSEFSRGYSTQITTLDSGVEERVQRWGAAGRARYNARYGIKSVDDLFAVQRIHMICQGATFGFRYKDWMDYSTGQTGIESAVTPTDVPIGTGDGSTTVFQLQKRYTIGNTTIIRNLQKPIEGTVRVALNGIELVSDFTVNYASGEITSLIAPNAGVVVTAGCEFHTPVRFGEEVDGGLPIRIEDFDSGTIPDIPLVEDLDTRHANEAYNYGGAAPNHGDMNGADVSINALQGRLHCFAPTDGGLSINLPDETYLAPGGCHFFLRNDGSQTLTIRDAAGSAVATMAPSRSATVVLGYSDAIGTKSWYAQVS
ncbi:MAG: DUF2460 domain-containing protein [Planctomycetota bacterium]